MKKKLLFVVTILTVCFIWGNSLLPGSVSSMISEWVKDILNFLFSGNPDDGMSGDGVLRKVAHALEYTVLGVELTLIVRAVWKKPLSLLFLGGLSAAFIDETIQLFIPGRAGAVQDMWIDLGGFCTGALITLFILKIMQRKAVKIKENSIE